MADPDPSTPEDELTAELSGLEEAMVAIARRAQAEATTVLVDVARRCRRLAERYTEPDAPEDGS